MPSDGQMKTGWRQGGSIESDRFVFSGADILTVVWFYVARLETAVSIDGRTDHHRRQPRVKC